MSFSGVDPEALREQQRRQQECTNAAIIAGAKASATALLVGSGLCGALIKYSDFFRSHFTMGAKASFVMLPTFYMFWWSSERAVARCSAYNNQYKFMRQQYQSGQAAPPAPPAAAAPPAASGQ